MTNKTSITTNNEFLNIFVASRLEMPEAERVREGSSR